MADRSTMSEQDKHLMEKEICSDSETADCVEETFVFGEDLELNRFDGLPFSSRYYKLLQERQSLPVWKAREEFLDILVNNRLVIVSGTTKTGKSTQIPQWCAEFCLSAQYQHGVAVSTQIHSQQAVSLALRVADEMDVNIGHEVGYTMPLETCCSTDTVLRFCTDALLLREMMSDPMLEHYGAIVIDQAHERTVSTDILLGLLQDILVHRPDLRVVILTVSSMTDRLLAHYGSNVPVVSLEALCPAEVVYSNCSSKDYFYSALRLVLEIHRTKEEGDVVLFLASAQEVVCARAILQREGTRLGADLGELVPVVLCPGHGRTPPLLGEGMGSRGTVTTSCRRVFLSTSQGEDMFWAVDSVNFVIDVGLEKRHVYHPRLRATSEVLRSISRYQADIRKQLIGPTGTDIRKQLIGPTGTDIRKQLTGPTGTDIRKQLIGPTGKCFCLYPKERVLPVETSPQILDANLTFTILFLKRMEIAGLRHCDFITRPDPEGLMQSLEELDYLAALDDDGNLSEIGIIISELPLDAQMAKALLASCEFDCVNEVVTIAAMLSAPSCFLEPPVGRTQEVQQCHRKFRHPEGDHFTLINIYNAFKYSQRETYFGVEKWCQDYHLNHRALQTADAIRSELTDILKRIELPISETSFGTKTNTLNIKRALLAGFFMQIARDVDGSGNYFMLTNRHMAQVHPASSYGAKAHQLGFPEWVLFHEYTLSGNHGIRTVSEISPAVFIQTAPQYFYYNLPPSESKDLLQHILDRDGSGRKDKQQTLTINSEAAQSYDRCVLQ
ncbi:putative pre-mRNA-splicing factor ATP-dependent RNA helicase DHX32 isoform X3 [Oncorhynchus keta]|uniref:putative pre-mRNA-splicing factor ATP-dependent RNA helicase DHX32 isoform X2 n=1 Tax=Oncorhynchus keta TaxID=8018 RepID=UPI00227B23C3|nr:putative pre-mRNA-splicing factor ATP-dependent RNA helicase DHX32 isoform X2 [Oncorhynchus keta]XP_052369966.1 putative pre-mRNA-splicing factor ATP-dependent RNA helicase DHX32 isoform X3 [Oncorhynchus keta]